MTTEAPRSRSAASRRTLTDEMPWESAVLGLREYWYPVFSSADIGKKPVAATIMGDPIVFMRGQKDGKVYAMRNECVHRGTRLSIGKGCEFPGTNTITCPYHGWTYDLGTGMCVAVLPEGPESQVPGKIRIQTYPIEEFKGVVWIWMGDSKPVPLEEDLPGLMKRPDTIVKFRHNVKYGNWRWHVENPGGGHAQMVHRDSPRMWFNRPTPSRLPGIPVIAEDYDGIGVESNNQRRREGNKDAGFESRPSKAEPLGTEFPGLGQWYVPPLWRRILFWPWLRKPRRGLQFGEPVQGVAYTGKLFLPGMYRQPHFPSHGDCYYEWYVPVDEDHYIYAQVSCLWGTNPVHRAWKHFWFHAWSNWTGPILFNNQDAAFVRETTDFTKRRGIKIYPMAKISANDDFDTLWREFANENARGVGYKARAQVAEETARAEPVIAGGSED